MGFYGGDQSGTPAGANAFIQGFGILDTALNSPVVGGMIIIPRAGNLQNVWFGIYDTSGAGVPNNTDTVSFFLVQASAPFATLASGTLLYSLWFAGAVPDPFQLATIAIPGVTLAQGVRFLLNGFSGAVLGNGVQTLCLLEIA